MRAFAFLGLLVVVGAGAPSTASAAATCTGVGPGCTSEPGTECLRDPAGGGVCVPPACLDLGAACFEGSGTAAERFAAGDCDGDLRSNAAEELDSSDPCLLPLVVTMDPDAGTFSVEPGRLDVPGGAQISPTAFTDVGDAFAVACQTSADCPIDTVWMQPVRCVLVPTEPAASPAWGACTYFYPLPDDDSCLSHAPDANACFAGAGSRNEQWAHGDCDGDGIINKQDGPVCRANLVAVTSDGASFACAPGTFDADRCAMAGLAARQLTPTLAGCADAGGAAPFGACCATAADCPAEVDSFARCVLFQEASGEARGACLYEGTPRDDDRSCLEATDPGIRPSCFASTPDYGAFAAGNCDDECSTDANYFDPALCACATPPENDAAVPELPDAAITPTIDAGVVEAGPTPEDAGAQIDAAGPDAGPTSFFGGGCRCAAGVPRGAGAWGLAAFAATLASISRIGRRRRS